MPQATARSSWFLHSLHVWRRRHHTNAINSMSDKDLDKDRTETETSLEVWNAGREYECSVDLYFGNREGDEAKRSGNTTSIAQEAILQLQAPSIPTLLQTLCEGNLVQRKKSPRACNNNKRWFSEPLQALTLRLFLRRRVLAWIRACNDKRLLSEALQILTLMLSLIFLL